MTEPHPYNTYRDLSRLWASCEISKRQPLNAHDACRMIGLYAELIGDAELKKKTDADLAAIRRHLACAANGV